MVTLNKTDTAEGDLTLKTRILNLIPDYKN